MSEKKELTRFGRLLYIAMSRKKTPSGKPYTLRKLAAEADIFSEHLSRACRGISQLSSERIQRVCRALDCDDTMCEALLNAAGFASPRQEEEAEQYLHELEHEEHAEDEEEAQEAQGSLALSWLKAS